MNIPAMASVPSAFLSYAHIDDLDGDVTRFVRLLKTEISMQLGREFEIFLDREGLKWGQNWQERIEQTLDTTAFLIVILSPGFFASEYCRDELQRFRQRERELGRNDLILSIVWIQPDEFSDESHELAAFLKQRQFVSWEEHRHDNPYLATARREAAKLARQVREAVKRQHVVAAPKAAAQAAAPAPRDVRPEPPSPPAPTPEQASLLAELAREDTSHLRRWEIGVRLAEIGDTREGVGLKDGLPDILWRPIPGGSVAIEEHGAFPVQPFQMAAYPVTAAQFRAFVEAKDGLRNKDWWQDLDREKPTQEWEKISPNYPVTYISWYDATAFCRWLSAQAGYEVRLPDEWEWQWAAQSARPDFAFFWGPTWEGQRANTLEAGIQRTTAVGMYGASHQQVFDLAGTVWEWCRNGYDNPRKAAAEKEGTRVLRGGSWFSLRGDARAAVRSFALSARPVQLRWFSGGVLVPHHGTLRR